MNGGPLLGRSEGAGEFKRRYRWLALAVTLAFFAVTGRLFQLQVMSGEEYAQIAHENIIRKVTLPTTRGVIYDAYGKILASSRPAHNVYVVPGRVMPSGRPPRRFGSAPEEPDVWPHVADVLRLNPDERAHFGEKLKVACTTDEDKSPCWRALLVKEDVERDVVAELRQHQSELPGVEVLSVPVRFYPKSNLGSHTVGYVAEVDAEALKKYRPDGYESMTAEERQKTNPLSYEAGDVTGATGVERAWESYLRGQRGWEKRVVDARGRYHPEAEKLIDVPARQEPVPGRNLRLTVDIELEQAIERAMKAQLAGAAVVVEVKTGRLLAVYSKPDFDPNDLSGGAGRARIREAFNKLYTDPLRPMLDKVMSGAFQPGSTFKPFSAIAALENKKVDPSDHIRCDGWMLKYHRVFHCTHVHGRVNMHDAIAESCNIYFFNLADEVGLDNIAKVAADFGLGQKTGIGVNPEAAGRIPTRAWYALRYQGHFQRGFTLNAAIGQGADAVTPLQLALAYAALGNGGTLYLPEIVRAVETPDGELVQEFPPRLRRKVQVSAENLARVTDALYGVVNDTHGTAYPVRDPNLDVAGKTGTAQTGPLPSDIDPKKAWYYSRDHAWFASFYPAKAPEIAVVALVEHGGSGPTIAAPIAIQIIREYVRLARERSGKPPLPSDAHPPPPGDAAKFSHEPKFVVPKGGQKP